MSGKYHNIRCTAYGITFDSKLELLRYEFLLDAQNLGIIKDLNVHVPFRLIKKSDWGREIKYVADFTYVKCDTNEFVVEDCKSPATITRVYLLKRRLMGEIHGIKIKEVFEFADSI